MTRRLDKALPSLRDSRIGATRNGPSGQINLSLGKICTRFSVRPDKHLTLDERLNSPFYLSFQTVKLPIRFYMKPRRYFIFLNLLTLALIFSACVSVNLKTNAPTKSEAYGFTNPPRPFFKMKSDQADHAWQNEKTGNTIAVLSECSESRDPSLTSLEGETIQALTNYQVAKTQELTYQARAARRTLAEGSLDGIPVMMDILTFKKNSCAYTLTYMGRASGFEKERSAFDNFLKGFVVP